jgi:hypothetical protein
MTWTATLREAKKNAGRWDVSINYTNGVTTETLGYVFTDSVSDADIKDIARTECTKRNNADAASTTLTGTIDISPPAPPAPPSQADIDKTAWFTTFTQLRKYRMLADNGLMSQNDARITSKVATLKATWLDAYFSEVPIR